MTGIRRTPRGWQAFVVVRGRFYSKRFPPDAALTTMKHWRDEQRVRVRLGAALPQSTSTFAQDVQIYLKQVQSMPTLDWRKTDLALWLQAFGPDRDRRTITAGEVRAQLECWRLTYAANTVNHRRTALMHLFSVLDGKSAPNPARDVPRYRDDSQDAPPRALSLAAIDVVLAHMRPSQTRARLMLFRYTGWPPAQMARVLPTDVRWDEAVWVRPRRKGEGIVGEWLPLLPEAWTALREFKRLGCWGNGTTWSTSSARRAFRLAARKARRALAAAYARRTLDRATARALRAELLDVTPYQLRHSFGTLVAAVNRDDRAVQTLMQHADIRTTHRYTKATVDPRTAAALASVAAALKGRNGG